MVALGTHFDSSGRRTRAFSCTDDASPARHIRQTERSWRVLITRVVVISSRQKAYTLKGKASSRTGDEETAAKKSV